MFIEHVLAQADFGVDPSSRLAWFYVSISLLTSFAHYRLVRKKGWRHFFSDAFSRQVWLTRSAFVDIIFFCIYTFGLVTFFLGLPQPLEQTIRNFFKIEAAGLLAREHQFFLVQFAWSTLQLIVIDSAAYLAHRICHFWPPLWAFHAVHHSADNLNLLTSSRTHIVEVFFNALVIGSITGVFGMFTVWLFGTSSVQLYIFGIIYYIPIRAVIKNLRHSRLWLRFPCWLSHFISSPAMHQVHHSNDPKHFQKNLAFDFAFIDWIFGTLYIPREDEHETLQMGVGHEHLLNSGSFLSCFLQPFFNLVRQFRN